MTASTLSAVLLMAILAAVVTSVALFLPALRPRRVAGAWPATRRLAQALIGTAALAAVGYAALWLLSIPRSTAFVAVAAFVVASVVWLPATRRWNARAHLCWAASVLLLVSYLVFILHWTVVSGLGVLGTLGGLVLWLLELIASAMAAAYLWELCDALGTEHWRRRVGRDLILPGGAEPRGAATVGEEMPFVSLHMPAHNEPPDMVIATLTSLLRIDYPRYEIIAIDDNTDDEALWRPVQSWCAEHGVKFVHLADWPGYKSGALNYALGEMMDPATEIVGVVDSDYQIGPDFLRRCVPLFRDPSIGFIQAPQDYREWTVSPYLRRLYFSYKYFFAVSQPSRNEHDGAIFAGTMGLIRRRALEHVGGWDEWCITEDAELSLRLLRAGWSGLHVDASMGRGVMPLTFEALKSQRYRWCFGGIQILRMHWRSLLPGQSTRENRLSIGQRWAYLSGALQWYGDLLGLVFFGFLLAGALNLALGGDQLFRKLSGFLIATVPLLVGLGLVRAVALLRRGTGAGWSDALGAFFIWQSTALVCARASVSGLFARQAEFLRTPKTGENASLGQALRANWAETALALLGVAGIVGALTRLDTLSGPLLAALLLVPTLGLAAAPFNSLAAGRAQLPPELEARRRSEWRRDRRAVVAGATAGVASGVAVAAAVAIIGLLTAPGAGPVAPPDLVEPRPPASPSPSPGAPSPAPSPAGSSPAVTPPAVTPPAGTPPGTPTGGSPSGASPPAGTPGSTTPPSAPLPSVSPPAAPATGIPGSPAG